MSCSLTGGSYLYHGSHLYHIQIYVVLLRSTTSVYVEYRVVYLDLIRPGCSIESVFEHPGFDISKASRNEPRTGGRWLLVGRESRRKKHDRSHPVIVQCTVIMMVT